MSARAIAWTWAGVCASFALAAVGAEDARGNGSTAWGGQGTARIIRTFAAIDPEGTRVKAPPLLETKAGIRLETGQSPQYGAAPQFVYDVDASLWAVARTDRGRKGSDGNSGGSENVRLEVEPGPQLFAGMSAGRGLDVFVGQRDTLRYGDRDALGGRAFRPGVHASYDAGFFRLIGSPYFRELSYLNPKNDLFPERTPPGAFGDRALPPGQFIAALVGEHDFSLGVFYETYRNNAGFAAEYAGIGASLYRGQPGRGLSAGAAFEHVSNRGNSRSAPDGSERLGGAAARIGMQGEWQGLLFVARGFVAEPALIRRGSASAVHERSGYVSPHYSSEDLTPLFSDALSGVPAPLLCSRCDEGYVLSADPGLFRSQAMTAAVGLGHSWRTGSLLFAVATIVPLLPRERGSGGPFADLHPMSTRMTEYGLRVRQTLRGGGEISASYSRLELREHGRSRGAAEAMQLFFTRTWEVRR